MQWKLSEPHRLADRFHRWFLGWGFPALARIAPRWPRPLLFANARWIIAVVMGVYPGPKRAIRKNLARILDVDPDSTEATRAMRSMLRHFAYYWVDLFRFAQLPARRARGLLEGLDGYERVEEARRRGDGAILLTAHLGNWELGGVLLGQAEHPVSVVYVPDQYPEAERFRSLLRQRAGVEEIPISLTGSLSSLPVLRALREGRVIAMQGDRDFRGGGHSAELFGGEVSLPTGPFLLSRLTGAPIVPTFLTYTENLRFHASFREPIRIADSGDRDADVAAGIERWTRVLEQVIRTVPDQWYTFYDVWGEPPATPREADRRDPAARVEEASG